MINASIFFIRRHRINVDGAGIRTLIGLSECPLHCQYCLNPQCRREALGHMWDVKHLVEIVNIDNLYFVATKGGVTFGGGEPGLHFQFISEFRSQCPKEWTIAIETSLNYSLGVLEELEKSIDVFIIDIKDMNPEIYKRYTGCTNEKVYKNLQYLYDSGREKDATIRIPLLPNYNSTEDIQNSRQLLMKMGFTNLDVIPYVEDISKIYERAI